MTITYQVQGHERKGEAEELSRLTEHYGDPTTKCNVRFWVGSRSEKYH